MKDVFSEEAYFVELHAELEDPMLQVMKFLLDSRFAAPSYVSASKRDILEWIWVETSPCFGNDTRSCETPRISEIRLTFETKKVNI